LFPVGPFCKNISVPFDPDRLDVGVNSLSFSRAQLQPKASEWLKRVAVRWGFSAAVDGRSAHFTAGSSQLMHLRSVRPAGQYDVFMNDLAQCTRHQNSEYACTPFLVHRS
jgi:hypothetical protein